MFLEIFLKVVLYFILLGLLWTAITYLFQRKNFFSHVGSRWHESFYNQHFSAKEIYASIVAAVQERQVPNISFSVAMHYQGGYFSEKREYLRIGRGEVMFLICAAPFGTDYFISCWVGGPMSNWKDFVRRIPIVGQRIYRRMNEQTFFQMDTETMFQEVVKYAVKHVVEGLNAAKGVRPLVELEKKAVAAE